MGSIEESYGDVARGGGQNRARRSSRGTAIRIFLTCWIVYTLHFATNIVREYYPALALGDHFSFKLDEYAGLHPDLFEKEGFGWRTANNPGVSFLAAVPYALARPLIDQVVRRVREQRKLKGESLPPTYRTPWPNSRRFFEQAWQRGLDVKLGLAAFTMTAFFMTPLSALSVVVVFLILCTILGSERKALWFSLVYAFGTPVFYRAASLNHNMALGILAFAAFYLMWDPGGTGRLSLRRKLLVGGLGGGVAVLFDYSGVVFLAALYLYGLLLRQESGGGENSTGGTAGRNGWAWRSLWYGLGALGPIALLWFYQWKSFGNPFLPAQAWMPPVEWTAIGYRGYGLPKVDLLLALIFDYRFGLFVFSPLLLLAFGALRLDRGESRLLPARETWFIYLLFLGLWVFFGGNQYTHFQFNSGVRYLTPVIPFLFLPTAAVLARLRFSLLYPIGILSVFLTWSLTMYRDVEQPLGVLDPVVRTLVGGFQLPALSTFQRLAGSYGGFSENGVSPLPLFLLAGVAIFGIWYAWQPSDLRAPDGA